MEPALPEGRSGVRPEGVERGLRRRQHGQGLGVGVADDVLGGFDQCDLTVQLRAREFLGVRDEARLPDDGGRWSGAEPRLPRQLKRPGVAQVGLRVQALQGAAQVGQPPLVLVLEVGRDCLFDECDVVLEGDVHLDALFVLFEIVGILVLFGTERHWSSIHPRRYESGRRSTVSFSSLRTRSAASYAA